MGVTMLTTLVKVGGVTALVIGVFYLLYRQILILRIFAKMSRGQTFVLLFIVAILVWALAIAVVTDLKLHEVAMIFGSHNSVNQGVNVGPR